MCVVTGLSEASQHCHSQGMSAQPLGHCGCCWGQRAHFTENRRRYLQGVSDVRCFSGKYSTLLHLLYIRILVFDTLVLLCVAK